MRALCPCIIGQARIEGDQQVEGLRLANLTDNETVGAHPQRFFHETPQRDLARAFQAGLAALQSNNIAGVDGEFEGLLDGDDALTRSGEAQQGAEQCGFRCNPPYILYVGIPS